MALCYINRVKEEDDIEEAVTRFRWSQEFIQSRKLHYWLCRTESGGLRKQGPRPASNGREMYPKELCPLPGKFHYGLGVLQSPSRLTPSLACGTCFLASVPELCPSSS